MKTKKQLIDFEHKGNEKHHFKLRPALLSLCMLTFIGGYSQTGQVNLNLKNASVKELFREIEKQTSYRFSYRDAEVNNKGGITISGQGKELKEVLTNELAKQQLSYTVSGNKIIVSPAKNEAVSTKEKKVTGKVVDTKGEPVIGATIMEKGTNNGTITDFDGNFTLNVSDKSMIEVSYIGYQTQSIKAVSDKELAVTLREDTELLDEVVVIGYGTQKKGSVATSITTVKSEQIQNRPVQTIGEALQGNVPGLNVTVSAAPGASPSLQLRGYSSLNGGGSPLILVDGVPADFNFLNPEDIESVSVLKDAASAAIYGSRAANGVLLITTKRGKQGEPKFRYNGSFGINTPSSMPESLSSAEYARIKNETEINMGRTPMYSEDDIRKFKDGSDPNRFPNTDWLELAINNSYTTRHSIEASGGTNIVKYILSSSFDHQTGVFPRTQQNVFNVRSGTDIKLSKKMKIGADFRYQLRDLDEFSDTNGMYKQLLYADPTMVAYYTDGSYGYNSGFFPNPLVSIYEGGHSYSSRHEFSSIFKLEYEIIEGLKFTGIANIKYAFRNKENHTRKLQYKDYFTQEIIEKGDNAFSDRRDYNAYYNLQALLNYRKSFSLHNLDILGGYQQEREKSDWLSGTRTGYPTDIIWELNPGPKDNWSNDGNGQHWALASFIGRINYDYNNKYIVSMNMRSDASSRFAKGYRWATFPSVALAWRLSQESFMKSTKVILDDLKLRASWGQTGIATGLGLYPSYTTIGMGGIVLDNKYIQTSGLKSIGNNELGWERSEMLNIGIDAILFNNRLNLTAEYYIKRTKDILLNMPVPLEYGFGKDKVNIGEMQNKGWELTIGWRDNINDFNYDLSFNLSDNKNEVIDLAGTGPWKGTTTYTDEGLPFNSLYGYESMGLFQSDDEVKNAPFQNSNTKAGDIRYKDINGDKKIDANDRVVLGDPYAHYLFGFKISMEYKGFDFSMFFQGIGKKDRIITDNFIRPFYDSTIFEHQLDYWTPENKDAKYPRILNKEDANHNYQYSDHWKINAGYLRMKNLSFGYNFPNSWVENIGLERLRLYFSANNLFTISDFVPGLDPESSSSTSYPFAKTFSFGLNVQF